MLDNRDHDFSSTLLRQALGICTAIGEPRLTRATLVDPAPAPDKEAEFGQLEFDDGHAGLYYAWLGGEQATLQERYRSRVRPGLGAIDLAELLIEPDDAARSIGLAAINALTARLFTQAGYTPPEPDDSFGGLALQPGDRLGMVGNFPSLVRQARARNLEVLVLEKKPHMARHEPGLVTTPDPSVLRDANKILCTGTTLLNNSLDRVLPDCRHAERLALVGPTAGCLPDLLFERGFDFVASGIVTDPLAARARIRANEKLAGSVRRTLISRDAYPGFATLLANAQSRRAN